MCTLGGHRKAETNIWAVESVPGQAITKSTAGTVWATRFMEKCAHRKVGKLKLLFGLKNLHISNQLQDLPRDQSG